MVTDECQVVKHVSDQGIQNNNGPHQDQVFDNPTDNPLMLSAGHCGPKIRFGLGGGGGGGEGGLMHPIGSFMKGV